MARPRTEEASDRYRDLETWSSAHILDAIVEAQRASIDAVGSAVPALVRAGEAVAERMRRGGRLVYAGAGSPGLMVQADALELPGTYGIAADCVPVLVAGGPQALHAIPSGAEDDAEAAAAGVDGLMVGPDDAVLSVSASGTTPFALGALRRGKARGALAIGMASNEGMPLLTEADIAILLPTPPEVIAGSTRMNAGTAQKCALNMLSTLVGIRLGHVHQGMMVNVRVENEKLRRRALGIIMRAAGVDEAGATRALDRSGGEVKVAILLAGGVPDAAAAQAILARHGGEVRASLADLASRNRTMG
jgi:N-acetylmuramic acid 6-phosphate etherase